MAFNAVSHGYKTEQVDIRKAGEAWVRASRSTFYEICSALRKGRRLDRRHFEGIRLRHFCSGLRLNGNLCPCRGQGRDEQNEKRMATARRMVHTNSLVQKDKGVKIRDPMRASE